ncbi:hypothetical protein J7337_012568 [Fusarium musae]|uniref:Hydrophobin n=1 Tax=Fusarium musae TaxID=1042133 RepID=A0A9P8IJE6_9HYPO|nr:hypothetical protein J7337_012568 [Fusarium musae]KAG9495997.1 hypothetical protein J7337_012568 [Fusarium musae]
MKASFILALPAIAAAAATPQMEERQLGSLFNPACLLRITGIMDCIPTLTLNSIVGLREVLECPVELVTSITNCLNVRLPPVPGTK